MPKRSRKAPGDYNVNAARIVAIATGQDLPKPPTLPQLPKLPPLPDLIPRIPKVPEPAKPPVSKKNRHAVALGRKGGKVGGKARAASLTPEERHTIAVKAARARWGMADE